MKTRISNLIRLALILCVVQCKPFGDSSSEPGSKKIVTGNHNQGPSYSDNPHVDRFLELLRKIEGRSAELEREKDRRGKLRIALTGSEFGCMHNVPIKTIKLVIKGYRAGDKDVTSIYSGLDKPADPSGKSIFNISLKHVKGSEHLTFENDEKVHALFHAGGSATAPEISKIFTSDRTDFKFGDLDSIELKKIEGVIETEEYCEGGGATSFQACKKKHKYKEVDRYKLLGLKVYINNLKVYEKNNIDFLFSEYGDSERTVNMTWKDDKLFLNEVFVQASQVSLCDQYK